MVNSLMSHLLWLKAFRTCRWKGSPTLGWTKWIARFQPASSLSRRGNHLRDHVALSKASPQQNYTGHACTGESMAAFLCWTMPGVVTPRCSQAVWLFLIFFASGSIEKCELLHGAVGSLSDNSVAVTPRTPVAITGWDSLLGGKQLWPPHHGR